MLDYNWLYMSFIMIFFIVNKYMVFYWHYGIKLAGATSTIIIVFAGMVFL